MVVWEVHDVVGLTSMHVTPVAKIVKEIVIVTIDRIRDVAQDLGIVIGPENVVDAGPVPRSGQNEPAARNRNPAIATGNGLVLETGNDDEAVRHVPNDGGIAATVATDLAVKTEIPGIWMSRKNQRKRSITMNMLSIRASKLNRKIGNLWDLLAERKEAMTTMIIREEE